jgi:multidrug transporter EmrE-like cation transporter
MKWFLLLFGVFTNASASILIKIAVSSKDYHFSINNPLSIFGNYYLILGIGLYGITFLLYALALLYIPLNIAHPILTSGSIMMVVIASTFFMGESFTLINFLGISFIVIGVIALTVN